MSSDDFTPKPSDQAGEPNQQPNQPLRARVPDHVADGCFSTGAIVMTGPSEFVVDFLQTIGRPQRVTARVVIPHPVMPQFIDALKKNVELYKQRFGELQTPTPQQQDPNARRPSPQEIYDDLKLPDEVLSGTYANGVMISHGATEFGLDFLTSFFPQSAVSARVYVASGQVPRLLGSLQDAVNQLQARQAAARAQQEGSAQETLPPPADDAPPSTDPSANTDAPPSTDPPSDPEAGDMN